jgi:hypothetical protein
VTTLIAIIQGIGKTIFSFGFLNFMWVFLTLLAIALITLIIFLFVRMYEIRQEDKRKKSAVVLPTTLPTTAQGSDAPAGLPVENKTWKSIRERLLGDNQSEWKLSIIEADIYLDRLLDDKGFHGDTTSDKLKQVTPDKLPSINMAREVHFIRNRIAHDGAAFVLTMPEARRLLSYYEVIFTDLGAI